MKFLSDQAYATCAIFLGLLINSSCPAQSSTRNHSNNPQPKQQPEIAVFLRISSTMVDRLLEDSFAVDSPIDRKVDKISLQGHATGDAKLSIDFVPGKGRVGIMARVKGKAQARLTAKAAKLTAVGVYHTEFQSSKKFSFDGIDFGQRPTRTLVVGKVDVHQICSSHQRMVGKLVRRITANILQRKQGEIDSVFNQAAQESINGQLDSVGEELVTTLNQLDRYAEMVKEYFPNVSTERIHLQTTESHFLAGFGPPAAEFPEFAIAEVKQPAPEIEVWIKTRPIESAFIKLLADWEVAHDLLKTYLPEEEAKQIAENLQVVAKRGYSVLRVGVERKAIRRSRGLSQALSRSIQSQRAGVLE